MPPLLSTTRSLRHRDPKPVVYELSSDDEEEEESYEDEKPATPAQPESRQPNPSKFSLRERGTIAKPNRLDEYVNTDEVFTNRRYGIAKRTRTTQPKKRKAKAAKKKSKSSTAKQQQQNGEDDGEEEGALTLRNEERRSLETTKRKRDQFYVHYRNLFEPLLPDRNYISKLVEKREKEQDDDLVVVEDDVVPYRLLESQPEKVQATMKPYQLAGLSYLVWLYKNGVSGILGDEMGLGKTLQTLSLFSYLTTYEPVPAGHRRPFLVVCPLSVVSSWVSECKRWTPHLRCLRFHGPATERNRLKKIAESGELLGLTDEEGEGRGYDVVVTSYEIFEREKSWFRRAFVWRYVVLDEGHKIKNEKTAISQSLQGLKAEFRLILTGTPLQNNLQELWALLHWLYPDVFADNTNTKFENAFNLTFGKNDIEFMDHSRLLLELVMLRRMKGTKGVNLNLPPKTELLLYLPLSPMQRFWYKRLLTRVDKSLLENLFSDAKSAVKSEVPSVSANPTDPNSIIKQVDKELAELDDSQWAAAKQVIAQSTNEESGSGDGKWRKLMNLLMQLRKACNHPYLLPGAEPAPYSMDYAAASAALMLASSKFIFLDKLIETLCIKEGRKVLIFSGFTKMLDLVEDFMFSKGGNAQHEKPRFKFGRLDGTTPRARRNLAIRLFNSDPDWKVMLISTRAGGLGINLASASDVVMLDTDWNPQADLQAQARAHRIGQKNPVTVYRLITQGTVEEQMMGRIRKKLYLSAKVTEGMRDLHSKEADDDDSEVKNEAGDMPTMSTGQLLSLVRSGSRAIARDGIDPTELLSWDWDTMIKRATEYADEVKKEEDGAVDPEEEERKWLSEMEKVETRVFEGKLHDKERKGTSNRLIAEEWSHEARRIGMNRVVMIGNQPVLKETIGNSQWEAVATLSGKGNASLTSPKRTKRKITHQNHCQICHDGGEVYTCSGCPRVYHSACLDPKHQALLPLAMFHCPQHECYSCEQKTSNCGGLIYRCRWCEKGYCEDCLDWEKTELVGDSIPELEVLGWGAVEQAYWVKCQDCVALHEIDDESREACENMAAEAEVARDAKIRAEEEEERGVGLTEATTVESSGVSTPVGGVSTPVEGSDAERRKRKRGDDSAVKGRGGKKSMKIRLGRGGKIDAELRFKEEGVTLLS